MLAVVSEELSAKRKDEIACEILAYLADHPDAQDTLEGIVEWWLLERKIHFQIDRVKHVIEDLVRKEILIENKMSGQQCQYRASKEKHDMIRDILSRTGF